MGGNDQALFYVKIILKQKKNDSGLFLSPFKIIRKWGLLRTWTSYLVVKIRNRICLFYEYAWFKCIAPFLSLILQAPVRYSLSLHISLFVYWIHRENSQKMLLEESLRKLVAKWKDQFSNQKNSYKKHLSNKISELTEKISLHISPAMHWVWSIISWKLYGTKSSKTLQLTYHSKNLNQLK